MRILFLNQYFPPDPAPTGVLLRELADRLQAAGHAVDFVAARQDYRAGQRKGGRMLREAKALGRMLLDGIRRPRPDVVISASSPPCLLLVATLVAFWHRAKSVHWIMDLYPEIAVSLGEIREGLLAKMIGKAMGWAYRRARAVVVLDEDMADRVRRYGVSPEVIGVWVFAPVIAQAQRATAEPMEPWTWIYSGNLGRAHEWETLLAAQEILEKRGAGIRLLFQGGGPSRPAAEARAAEIGLQQCEWKGYVDEAELPDALRRGQVLAVTQLPAAQGMLWPSKLGLILSLPRPILWVGPIDGAIARKLGSLPHAGVFAPGQAEQVADWLFALKNTPGETAQPGIDPREHREAMLRAWERLLEKCL
ncbi:colanic acid biosynthesis glycosyl transferase, putative [Chthoniobacter flavus Ellin428]|uniref:Colanic acid biosynthesis glycosyl transferase, putative n=1 Tax=Chthoniobacter flavus Ellin428 TaxID=497964 RepID=B4CW20_9BACT|nr:glycosyltransferase family 4 protein [Chthoniobacter flavus]EDY21612.1 colanic acid biosynthesis glycosyl transferase, putative [Chthoniobacter flavus Ellin428]TCO95551.1 glycosyltransferase involved in cell wall biosynthesis [Chthoniobacter flavus]